MPQIRYPIEPSVGAPAPADAQAAIEAALIELIGRDAVRSALQVDGFARRFVATVDNLGRTHAPPMSWPVVPAAGRFTVRGGDDGLTIGPENAARYAPFVSLVESVATDRAVALYVRFYPAFQRAYEELGFPGRHFNDRLIEVVDLLLATPKAVSPLAVQLSEVRGPYRPVMAQAWQVLGEHVTAARSGIAPKVAGLRRAHLSVAGVICTGWGCSVWN